MDSKQQAKNFLKQIAEKDTLEEIAQQPEKALETLLPESRARLLGRVARAAYTESLAPLPESKAVDQVQESAKGAAEKVLANREQELTDSEQFALEAIIIPGERPVVDIVNNGEFTVNAPLFASFSSDPAQRAKIQTALGSIGRIEVIGFPGLPYGGTGFVVAKNLLMTNRHVAELFSSGLGLRNLAFKSGMGSGVDFRQERDHTEPEAIAVRQVVMIHPFWDMALLEVDGLDGHEPLSLSVEPTGGYDGRRVAVVGYPAFDPRNPVDVQNQVFHGVYNVKRLQPGKAGGRRDVASFGHSVSAVTHDASTLGGNSGSAVFDPDTGTVLGLHFAGVYLDANFFVPTWELARDDRVVKAGANFVDGGRPDPAQIAAWWSSAEGATSPAATAPAPAGSSMTFTIPLQITVQVGEARYSP
jgi:endonuclease G